MSQVTIGDLPPITNFLCNSIILTVIYFVLAEIYKRFPILGFSKQSLGGTNWKRKPNDIHYTGAYKTLVILIQEIVAILISSHHFNFNVSTWWNTLWDPSFGVPPSTQYLPSLLEFMQPFWILGTIHYAIMLDNGPHQIRTWHKICAVCTTAIGLRIVYHAPNCAAHFVFAAKVPGLIESLCTVAHVRGIFYTKAGVGLAIFGTFYNSIMRFMVEPLVMYKVSLEMVPNMISPLDILFSVGTVSLLFIHMFFSIKAIRGLPKLVQKLKIQSKSE